MSSASIILHPEYDIALYHNVTEIPGKYDLLYDRAVTNYTFETECELADFLNRFEVSLLNIFLSKRETFRSSRLGKSFTYFSLEKVIRLLDKPLYHLFGERAPGPFSGPGPSKGNPVVEGFFLCCHPDLVADFMAMAQTNIGIRSYFEEKNIFPKEAASLLGS